MKQLSSVLKKALYIIRNPRAGKSKQIDKHHIYPKSRTETGFKVHDIRNLVMMNHTTHFGFHEPFVNCTPQEQLVVWAEINQQVLSDKAKALVKELWELSESEFYKEELLTRK